MSEEIEQLEKRIKYLEDANTKNEQQWDLLRASLLDSWRSIYLMSVSEPLQSESNMVDVTQDADTHIELLERPTKVETVV